MIRIETVNGKFRMYSHYTDAARIKCVPGRRWEPRGKYWTAPATPTAALEIVRQFKPEEREADEAFEKALQDARSIHRAQELKYKEADELPQPAIRKNDSWKHQLQAYNFALKIPAAMLGMAMGTGKSKVVVDLIFNRDHRRTLILCPKSVLDVWRTQLTTHGGLTDWQLYNETKGTTAKRAQDMAGFLIRMERAGRRAIVAINYEAAWRAAIADFILAADFDFCVLDESHKVKSPSGKASKFIAKIGDKIPYKLCLTGTMMPHSPLDIFGQYRFLDKGIFGTSYTTFKARYAIMGGMRVQNPYTGRLEPVQVLGYQNENELREKLERIAYQATKDVITLPEALHDYRTVELSAKTAKAYREMETQLAVEVEEGYVTAANALSKLLRLQQITSGYLPLESGGVEQIGTEKRETLAEILDDIAADEAVVVFARFRHDLDQIRAATKDSGREYRELSGRENTLKEWQQGAATVIGVQIQAGGVGIDLTRARYCIYYSMGYSLGDYEQSLARVHRPGQERPVFYIHLIAEGTVDKKVYKALQARKRVVEAILQGGIKSGA